MAAFCGITEFLTL